MTYEFQTGDGAHFVVDTATMLWGRVANHELLEKGDLVPMGAGRYSLDGRTPDTKGAGAGLSTLGILSVPYENRLVIFLVPNVEVEEDSFEANFPEDMQQYVVYKIQQPAPKAARDTRDTNSRLIRNSEVV